MGRSVVYINNTGKDTRTAYIILKRVFYVIDKGFFSQAFLFKQAEEKSFI